MNFTEKLKKLNVSKEFIEWAKGYPTLQEAWDSCERADWMFEIAVAVVMAKKDSEYHKQVVLTACLCAKTALKHLPKDEKRPLISIQTAEKRATGKATSEELNDAISNALSVGNGNGTAATSYAAYIRAAVCAATSVGYYANNPDDCYILFDVAGLAAQAESHIAICLAGTSMGVSTSIIASIASDTALKSLANIVRKNLECPVL